MPPLRRNSGVCQHWIASQPPQKMDNGITPRNRTSSLFNVLLFYRVKNSEGSNLENPDARSEPTTVSFLKGSVSPAGLDGSAGDLHIPESASQYVSISLNGIRSPSSTNPVDPLPVPQENRSQRHRDRRRSTKVGINSASLLFR